MLAVSQRRIGVLALVALAAAALLGAAPVRAASCKSANHQVSLRSGSVSPGSGTKATSFTFSVVYSSSAGCTPTSVQVIVNGVGTFSMTGTGTSYAAGVTFRRAMTLPPGSRAYSFRAVAGSGAGSQTVVLTSVSPAKVTVLSPTPTSPPTRPPPPPAASPVPTPSATPTPTRSAVGVTGGAPSVGGPGAWGGQGSDAGGGLSLPGGIDFFAWIRGQISTQLVWLIATAGGLCLFVLLSRPTNGLDLSGPTGAIAMRQNGPDSSAAGEPRVRRLVGDEAQMPRWLRPSVQAARHADPRRDRPRGAN